MIPNTSGVHIKAATLQGWSPDQQQQPFRGIYQEGQLLGSVTEQLRQKRRDPGSNQCFYRPPR